MSGCQDRGCARVGAAHPHTGRPRTFPASGMQVGPLCNGQVCPGANSLPLTKDGQIPYVKRPEDSTEYNNMVGLGAGVAAAGVCSPVGSGCATTAQTSGTWCPSRLHAYRPASWLMHLAARPAVPAGRAHPGRRHGAEASVQGHVQ